MLVHSQPNTSADASPYGPSVIDGLCHHTSASSLTRADPNSEGGCLRRWFYEKVLGIRAPDTESQKLGRRCHKEAEHYLRTGELVLSPIMMAGRHLMPPPDPTTQLVEQEISDWGLSIEGIPVVGQIDLGNFGRYYMDPQGEFQPLEMPELNDWKTSAGLRYAKRPDTLQMLTYGAALAQVMPTMDRVRLSHVYFQTRGKPDAKKLTLVTTREHISRRWELTRGVARTIIHAAREIDPEMVECNPRSCDSYNGCPHRQYCSGGAMGSLVSMFGEGAMSLKNQFNLPGLPPQNGQPAPAAPGAPGGYVVAAPPPAPPPQPPQAPGGYVVTQQQPPPAPPPQAPGGYVATQPPATPFVATAPVVGGAQPAPQPPPATPPQPSALVQQHVQALQANDPNAVRPDQVPAGFTAAIQSLELSGQGMPPLADDAAKAFCAMKGITFQGGGTLGSGALGQMAWHRTAEQVIRTASDIANMPAGPLPPDAPASNPDLAADPVPGYPMPGATPPPLPAHETSSMPWPKNEAGLPVQEKEGYPDYNKLKKPALVAYAKELWDAANAAPAGTVAAAITVGPDLAPLAQVLEEIAARLRGIGQ